jgi:hypothetical protein
LGDTVLPLEDPGALQLDLLGSEALEQTAPLAEPDRDDSGHCSNRRVVAGEGEDRQAVAVVATPAAGRLEGPPASCRRSV